MSFALVQTLFAALVFGAILWLLRRLRVRISNRLEDAATRRLKATAVGDLEFVRSAHIVEFLHWGMAVLTWATGLFFGYWWLTFTFRRFASTLSWGDSLRGFLLGQLSVAGLATVHALPNLFTVLVIVVLTRLVSRIIQLLFQAVEGGKITVARVHPETAEPTRKILTAALWLFAIVIAFPFLPGSESDAFKGVSVFVGLVLSLGSTGVLNQVMSGLTLIYSRALRVGEYVSVSDVTGTVAELGTFSTKIRTVRGEDVTIPNAVMVSNTVTNYSRLADTVGVFVPAEVTIGYDAPWRQVHALLLLAAARTPGIRREPAPAVYQVALEDPYVRYRLVFCLERPAERFAVLAAVHANIQDAFNEYGVQIMSPNYREDPATPKVVPRDQWFAAPASPAEPAKPGTPNEPL